MGRKVSTQEHRRFKKRKKNQKYISNPENLAKKRESNRLNQREWRQRRRQARSIHSDDLVSRRSGLAIQPQTSTTDQLDAYDQQGHLGPVADYHTRIEMREQTMEGLNGGEENEGSMSFLAMMLIK